MFCFGRVCFERCLVPFEKRSNYVRFLAIGGSSSHILLHGLQRINNVDLETVVRFVRVRGL